MAKVKEDLIAGQTFSDSVDGGLTATRTFLVSGITGSASSRMLSALNAVKDLGNDLRQVHPAIGKGTFKVVSLNVEAVQAGIMRVFVNYAEIPDENNIKIQYGATVQVEQTNKEFSKRTKNARKDPDKQIILEHTFKEKKEGQEDVNRKEKQGVFVEVQVPNASVSFIKEVPFDVAIVNGLTRGFVGRTNSDSFLGDPAGTWLCTGISGGSEDGGLHFLLTFEFQRNFSENGWDASIVFIDSKTDQPVEDPVDGEGVRSDVIIYREAPFAALRLQDPTQ